MSSCREIEVLLPAHAYRALEPAEHEAVDAHLVSCADCRRAQRQLAELPALLKLAGGTDAHIAAPPPLLEASVLAALPTSRRVRPRHRPGSEGRRLSQATLRRGGGGGRRLALVLTVAVVLLVIGLTQLPATSSPSVRLTLAASALAPDSRGVAILRPHPWGTEVDFQAEHLRPTHGTEMYEMWFVSPGRRVSAGTFTVGPGGRVNVTLASAAHAGQYRTLGVTLEPDGRNPARRGPNILHASVPA